MGFLSRTPGNPQPKRGLRERVRSVYDRRGDQAGHEDPAGKEILLDKHGNPTLVVVKGDCIGWRAKDGSLIPAPELPRNPAQWPESVWDDDDFGWRPVPRVRRL